MMDKGLKRMYKFTVRGDEEAYEFMNKIHNQLVGNEDYIKCNIVLNIDCFEDKPDVDTTTRERYVALYIYDECKEIPTIVI